jgi:hypothetical protein
MSEYLESKLSYIHPSNVTTSNLKNSPEGIILLSDVSKPDQTPLDVRVDKVPKYAEGREDSVYQVQFGDMTISGQTDSSPKIIQPVAIKAADSLSRAIREYNTIKYLNSREEGRPLTFRVLGFTRWGGNYSVITEFESGVVTYDNTILNEAHKPTESEISEALTTAALTLVTLNDFGLMHGDFQVKNTARDINNRVRIVDLTEMRRFNSPDDTFEDIALYIESLSKFGTRFSPVSPQQFDEYFLKTYEKNIPDVFPGSKRLEVNMAIHALRDMLDVTLITPR